MGRNRAYRAWGRLSGFATGAGATLTVALEESANGSTGWAAIPGVGTLAITQQIGSQGTTARPEIPSTVSPLPSLTFTTTKDYVRATPTLGGTSPVFPGVSVNIEPLDAAAVPSGR